MPNSLQLLGFKFTPIKSVPTDKMLLVDEVNKKILSAMQIPNEYFENAVRDGTSAVKIDNELNYKCITLKEMLKDKDEK